MFFAPALSQSTRFVSAMADLQTQAGITDTVACEFEIDDRSTRAFNRIDR
jgi:hypothetical protein